jgi:hypothetical protein
MSTDQKLAAKQLRTVQDLILKSIVRSEDSPFETAEHFRISKFALLARDIINSTHFLYILVVLILISAATVGIEIDGRHEENPLVLCAVDYTICSVFIVEIFLRMAANEFHILHYLRDFWNIVDFVIVLVSLLPFFGNYVIAMRYDFRFRLPFSYVDAI